MIIGSGLIANSLKNIDSEDMLYFASGVSNSLETRDSEFEREFSLLKQCIEEYDGKKLVYFSTLSIYDQSKQDSHYVLHKQELENYIKNNVEAYLILRVGNIVGNGGNPNTLFNFLKNQISSNNTFVLHKKARRLLIDIDDIAKFLAHNCTEIHNQTINLAFPYYYDLKEIIDAVEKQINKNAAYNEVDEGDFYKVSFDENIDRFFSEITPPEYINALAKKYI
ncbi:nucleoside-diphosphate-sugar epimerase [Chryseobacterium defluvii]|uniref:Nucleoside-diphosphate-sugar epimerase n=1 Tax=Chryseobacterium defluvii TaxID=160396 RepID=A0A840KDI0_9FLAO|nr:NAD-dependent epimerase/dehydratase family protein [Chryseobacterium defluvii]MBB4806605.1 nucleoside-diphosphate-sugar epimerase [Chryseobacterium defluvii]